LGALETSALGFGSMGMSYAYGPPAEESGTEAIRRALDLGITMIDTAEVYGPFRNEEVVGAAIAGRRDQVQLATKFGFAYDGTRQTGGVDSSPTNAKRALEGSLKRLGVDYVDLWYQHRVDPKVPIEETVGAMAEAVAEGKVRHLGLSEASAATIRRARDAPHGRRAERVLAVVARRRGYGPSNDPRARHRLRRIQPARPRLPDRECERRDAG
jgi:aryl-alcohol dehydrogenase-like predicted oxidoreductase